MFDYMLIAELTEHRHIALPADASVSDALKQFNRQRVMLLPVVQQPEQIWLGNVYRHDLLEVKSSGESVAAFLHRDDAVVNYSHHLLEAARLMQRLQLDVLPVTSEHYHYEGFLTRDRVNEQIVGLLNMHESGQVLLIEMTAQDFTLAQIVRFIEEENARILGLLVDFPTKHRPTYRVSVKINRVDAVRILAALRRHGYSASTPNQLEWLDEEFDARADELIHFLEL
jgi:signal-transduction protein with cAMP-binding, CBS, and nucleotidyltransferase domain